MDHFCLLIFHVVLSVRCSLVVTCWPLGSLVCDFFVFCHFPMWCPGSGVVLYCSDPDIWPSVLLLQSQ